jgi:hypothetical protein
MGGVILAPKFWSQWTAANPRRRKTLAAYFMPGTGLVAQEHAWADEFSLNALVLRDVTVREANISEIMLGGKNFRAGFGLDALRNFELIVDNEKRVVYLQPRNPVPSAAVEEHNRIGAVFIPKDINQGGNLIAHVLNPGPAYAANVRNGDELLKIDDLDATRWQTDPAFGTQSRFWIRPAGTKITLTLKRGEKEVQTDIVLRDLLGPKSK